MEAACSDDFEVLTATSAEAALEHMRRDEVGVIVADQRMPGTSGVELAVHFGLTGPRGKEWRRPSRPAPA